MADIEITRTETDTNGRYAARLAKIAGEGELTLSKVSDSLIIVDHTAVPGTMRGAGVASALAVRAIADARAAGQRIVPLCPFLRAYAQRHREETADVIQW